MSAEGDRGAGKASGPDSLSATQAEALDRACDRFEADWKAGGRPTIEDHLERIAGPLRSAGLGAFIAVELDWRCRRGECPEPAEYHARFPGQAEAVAAGFGPAAGLSRPRAVPARSVDPAHGLLLGLLAFQNHFIDREALLAALGAWVADKATPLGQVLLDRRALDPATHALLEALAKKHLEVHDGDAGKSLAALALGASTREVLGRIGDPEIQATLSHVGSGSSPTEPDAESTAGYRVGSATGEGQRFRVLRPHARGGLGAVYVALDTELRREVALKQILESHADDQASRSRFLLEAEITGGLEHPGIVPVYGLGTYGDGRPYYAMRFIRGDSLKEAIERFHADAALKADAGGRSLELRKLLRRFTDVCNAVDYAHSRGVLHRDIKPGNIIVGKYGETLVVDWGLAKATGRADAGSEERTLRPGSGGGSAETLPGSALGTPAYMSPEQADGDLEHLGPRSDVYSLGATLYFLLTRRAPFTDGNVDAVLRAVRRGELRPPRQVDPTIDRALEAVCLKAMARRPEDRYESCRALAEEVERWTADEPVIAWREPFSRRARRWGQRHRTAVAGAAAALLAGLVGLAAVAAVQARSNRALKVANGKTNDALTAETKAKQETQAALARSEESRRRAEAVLGFLKDDVLAAARPENQDGGLGIDVTVRKAVDAAEAKISRAFKDQPAIEAEVRDTLGKTYLYLGETPSAMRQFERVLEVRRAKLGADHPDTLDCSNGLAVAYNRAGRTAEAIALLEATLKSSGSKLGADHVLTLACRNNLAVAYNLAGRLDDAIKLDEATLKLFESKLGSDHPDTLACRNNLAEAYNLAGRTAEAVTMHEANLKLMALKFGPDHPNTLSSRSNLSVAYESAGRTAEAITLDEGTLKLRELKLGPYHPETLMSRYNLAISYNFAGRSAEAIRMHEETLKLRESKLGPDHPDTLLSRDGLGVAYLDAGRTGEAIAMHEATLKQQEMKLGPDHRYTIVSRVHLGAAYRGAGQLDRAVSLLEPTLQVLRAKVGPDHDYTLRAQQLLAGTYAAARQYTAAEPLLRQCLAIRQGAQPDDWNTFNIRSQLGGSLLGQKRYAEAEPLILRGYEGMKARTAKITAPSQPRLREAAERVVRLYEGWNKPDQAAAWKAKLGMPDLPADVFARP